MTELFDPSLVANAYQLIDSSSRVVIFTHIAPDGDAMGSSLAMYHWLRNRLSSVSSPRSVTVVTPNAYPSFLSWIPGADSILIYEGHEAEADRLIADADLHICLDFNEPKRIGVVGERLVANPCPKILIDHHLNPAPFASVAFSFPLASSTCELIFRFINHKSQITNRKSEISCEIATSIYTGLMTDTGNFAFNSNNPDLYEIIAALMRTGINKDAIYDAVFNQYSPCRLRLIGYALHRKMQIFSEHHLALITLSEAELQRFDYLPGDTEGLVNMPLQISDVYYSVFMREQPPKPGTPKPIIKISFRSQGNRPVNTYAHAFFGGGGHANAAGGEYCGSLGAAVRRFLATYPDHLLGDAAS